MDRTLEDSLNMESIESMDFDHSAVVVNQADICLEDNQDPNISMDIDIIEEQPPLLESGQEEVIVSDFMGEQFSFQDYTMPEDNSNANITIDANQINNLLVQNPTTPAPQHNIVKIKALPQQRVPKKIAPAAFPRQVAIAPKPVKGAVNVQFAIAPKPVAVVVNKNNMTKSIPMKNIVQGSLKGNTVLTQIGKQLVMVPSSAVGQKFKLTSLLQPSGSSESTIDLSQMMSNKLTNKPVQAKIIMQGSNVAESSEPSNSGGVLTKLVPVSGAHGHATYVMQQKTIPITIAQKKLLMTPPKTAKIVQKKQVINIKPQSPATQENVTTKKVVITANPSQSVVIRPINKTGTAQTMTKQNVIQTQHGQLHPINVPGKGIQFIKLLSSQPSKTGSLVPSNYVLADSKGNIIQLSDKVLNTSQSSLLVSAAPALTTTDKGAPKTKRLVRIAPVAAQTVAPTAVTPARPTQSLLAPTESSPATVSLEQLSQIMSGASMPSLTEPDNTQELADHDIHTDIIKQQSLSSISECGAEEETLADQHIDMHEVEIQCENTPVKREPYMEESSNSMDQSVGNSDQPEPNVIIVPASFEHSDRHQSYTEDSNISNGEDMHEMNVQTEILRLLSPKGSQSYLESSLDMEPRPGSAEGRSRKPCNCTKSQCLKLYCDCFASGEFCNGCNCNNCLNNLDHEEKRQRAIRSCLDRNPNAFRPKIGKGKTAGPEIIRRHNKGCNCKRSGCLKNYCECYEAKIACTAMCKCVGCRNVQETLQRRRAARARDAADTPYRPPAPTTPVKHACHMVTQEVIESVAHCLLAVVDETHDDPVHDVLLEFSRCVQDIITHAHSHSCCL